MFPPIRPPSLVVAGLVCVARLALAQPSAPSSPVPPDTTAPEVRALDVVVHGRRDVAAASAVTRERPLLQAAPRRSADELLTSVPGLFISQHGGEGKAYQIFYRGFDAVHGQDVEISAGGVPVNDVSHIHGQGHADLHFLPFEVVSAVEATPGPYEARQGDFAVAGSLRLHLGYEHPGVTAKTGLGPHGARRLFLAYRPLGAEEETFAAVELYRTDGYGPSRAAQRASAVAQSMTELSAGTSLRLLAAAHTGRFASPGVLRLSDLRSGNVGRFDVYDPAQGGSTSRTQLLTEVIRRDELGTFSLAGYLVLRSQRLRQNFTGYLNDPQGDGEQQLHEAVVAGVTGSYRLELPLFSASDHLNVGLSARTDAITQSQVRLSSADAAITARAVDARVRAQDVAGHAEWSVRPWSRLRLRLGARADGVGFQTDEQGVARSAQGIHLGKKATVDLRVTSWLRLLASHGEGFRSPQARSLAEGERTPFTTVLSHELGLRAAGPQVIGSVAAYRTALSDDLLFDHATGRNERVPATRRLGVTGDVSLTPRPWIAAAASATYTRSTFAGSDDERRAGDLVPYAPQWVARADLALSRAFGRWQGRFGLGSSWVARRPLPYGEWGDDLHLLDTLVGARVGPVEVILEVTNLLDAQVFDGQFVYASRWNPAQAASLVPERHVTVGAPRLWMITLGVFL